MEAPLASATAIEAAIDRRRPQSFALDFAPTTLSSLMNSGHAMTHRGTISSEK
jgi:hypothetical protein